MRALGAEYNAIQQTGVAPSLWRVYAAGHGIGGLDDPYELGDYVLGVSVKRAGRGELNSGTLVLDNSDGAFDRETGALYPIVQPNNAEIQVEMGTRLAAGPTYWRVLTGGVIQSAAPYDGSGSQISVSLGDRGRNLADIPVTSEMYANEPANDLITALFTAFADFAPGDFNLPALVHTIREAQWQTEPLVSAVNEILRPVGKCIFFDYDGTLSHQDLTPGAWASALTVTKRAVAQLDTRSMPPLATRIMVAGGPDWERPIIGEPEKFGQSTYAYDFPSGNKIVGVGDVYEFWTVSGYDMHYWFAGPGGRLFRSYASYVDKYYFTMPLPAGTVEQNMVVAFDPVPPGARPQVLEEWMNPGLGKSTSDLNPAADMTAGGLPLEVDMNIAVDGGAVTPVVFNWAGCNTRLLVAAQMQTALRALGGAFSDVTVEVGGEPVGGNFRYIVTSGTPGNDSAVVITDGAPNNCADDLMLGLANLGIETQGGDNRHEIHFFLDCGVKPALWVHFNFEVWAYPVAWGNPPCDVQVWDATLIERYGEIRRTLQAPLAMTFGEAEQAGQDEMNFVKGSAYQIRATLQDFDLRIEPHDVITIEKELGGDVICWVQDVTHSGGSNPQTTIDAIGLPT